ncbi:STAS domain-containing protein [Bacillus massiliglaciei]|uniref:STAS domain-containing protein n=1 Tax=Bacillus massiliglaciei TaxID=1816693 RepID=UPI000B19A4D7|nr:STAS domain-containing protein [Bacillus massiliglaciei]
MSSISKVGKYLNENAKDLANEIVDEIVDRFTFTVPKPEIEQAKVVYFQFIQFIGEAVTSPEIIVPQEILDWSKQNAEQEASLRGRISNIIERYYDTRLVFIDRMTDIAIDHGLSTKDVIRVTKWVNCILDVSITETVREFERFTQDLIKHRQKEINKLSAPIVPIQDSIAVLPLVGSFDYDRVEHLVTSVVSKIAGLNIECLIIDFSGIETIDAEIAGYIFNMYDALRLLGIHVIATGIRPDLANQVVRSGIDLSTLTTYATVKQAIESMNDE